jgi:integrase
MSAKAGFSCSEIEVAMAKRGHGEGSIYQRKDGRWVAVITLENRKRKMFYGKTRKEVQEKLRVALNEQKQGILATGPQQTVRQFLEQWLEEVHKQSLRPSTYKAYRMYLDKRIFPILGYLQLQKLTPQHVQSFYNRKLQEGLSAKSIRNTHGLLHRALDKAVQWGLVPRNVCDAVSLPKQTRHEIQPLTEKQARQLLIAARGHSLEGLLIVAVTTGMREGELLALRWRDINFDNRSLHIQRSMGYIPGKGYLEFEPKTPRGRRKIVLSPFVCEALKQHRTRQLEIRLKGGERWQDRDLVFCNIYGGYLDPSHLRQRFDKLLKEAGLPDVRFHDLRHSAATILLSIGVPAKVVQEILGHSQISMTMDTYSHVLPDMQQQAMDKMDELFHNGDRGDNSAKMGME